MSRQAYLRAMGIDVWVRRDLPSEATENPPTEPVPEPSDTMAVEAKEVQQAPVTAPSVEPPTPSPDPEPLAAPLDWNGLREAVGACKRCGELVANRTQTVFSRGDVEADWMVIGEAPGADEDRQGEPFVGRAGKLLDQMLQAAGWPRQKVFIANILKCRPPNNRDPRPEEARSCAAYLNRQIELVGPKLILVVGRVAAQNLLGTDAPLARLRGRVHHHGPTGVPVIVTYHPAYLLRTPGDKRKAWIDLKLALATYRAAR